MAPRKLPTPDGAEIVWIQHDPQAGREMKGMHPMLVLSPKAFVERTGLVIGLPLTHAEFNADNPFAVAVQGPKKEIGYILCHQPKIIRLASARRRAAPLGRRPQAHHAGGLGQAG